MKKIVKYFSLILFSAFFMFFLSSNSAKANYDPEKNFVSVSVSKQNITVSVTYQRGFSKERANYYWCINDNFGNANCAGAQNNSYETKMNYVNLSGSQEGTFAQGDASYADNNLTTQTFVVPKESDFILKNLSSYEDQTFTLYVEHWFCAIRNEVTVDGVTEYNGCSYYDQEKSRSETEVSVSINDLINDRDLTYNKEDIEDEDVKSLMTKIENIVNTVVLPIIWTILGFFLIIKGTMLGIQIVKSADEPQIRQEKVGALKWLVIGVAIAYLASFVVKIVVGFFENVFN